MSVIKRLKDHIDQLTRFLAAQEKLLDEQPDNFAAKLESVNILRQIEELRQQLKSENIKRENEVITLRFKGDDAQFGSIPLSIVGGLTNAFSNAIHETSKFIQFGKRGGKKVSKIVRDRLDLRLNAIGAGSTIFYISAKTSPDLFGESATQQTFDNFVDFISSVTAEDLVEKISTVGTSSIKHYSSFLKKLNDDNLEVDITIQSPVRDNPTEWKGTSEKIISLYSVLSALNVSEPVSVDFEGEIIALSKKGKIEVLSKQGITYHIDYPEDMLETIASLHIGQMCSGKILKTRIVNSFSGKENIEYDLIVITPF